MAIIRLHLCAHSLITTVEVLDVTEVTQSLVKHAIMQPFSFCSNNVYIMLLVAYFMVLIKVGCTCLHIP